MPRTTPERTPFNNVCCAKAWFPWEGSYVCVHCGEASLTLTHRSSVVFAQAS